MPTVLVVDDSAVDRCFVGELLAKAPDVQARYAVDGADALAHMDPLPDLIISDLLMPQIDGLALVTAVRERYPSLPVVLMTSQGNEEIAVAALQSGAASYVPKRALRRYLLETVQKVLTVVSHTRIQTRLMDCMTRSETTFVLENDAALFGPLIQYLQESAMQMGLWSATECTRVGVALEEALTNALYHGNLAVGSELREKDLADYRTLIEIRRSTPPYKDRRIVVEMSLSSQEAVFVVNDAGAGFDPAALPDPTDPANLARVSGRGVLLMRAFMDEISYNSIGNGVTMIKRRQSGTPCPPCPH